MEVKDKYEGERIYREKYQEERNVIRVSNYGRGYTVSFVNNNFINHSEDNRQETYSHDSKVANGDFCDVIEALTNFTPSFYDKEIILSFEVGADKIPEKEKRTIEKTVKKLEEISISHKNLLNSINKIKEIISDDLLYESKMIPNFR